MIFPLHKTLRYIIPFLIISTLALLKLYESIFDIIEHNFCHNKTINHSKIFAAGHFLL